MTKYSIVVSPIEGMPGRPVGFAGTERELGTSIDTTARLVCDHRMIVEMNISADPIPHARLAAYVKFAVATEKLDRDMVPGFDFRLLLEHTSPTGKPL